MTTCARRLITGTFLMAVGTTHSIALATPPFDTNLPPYDAPAPPTPIPPDTKLYIGPIAGLTLYNHVAPKEITVPLGTVLRFQQQKADGRVLWNGATPTSETSTSVRAERRMDTLGEFTVTSIVLRPIGNQIANHCIVRVVEEPRNGIRVRHVAPRVDPVELRNDLDNMETMEYFFGHSVADFKTIRTGQPSKRGEKATELPCYQSSTDRPVHFDVATDPPGFESLIEVRLGQHSFLAPDSHHIFREPGTHIASIGSPSRDRKIEFAVYRVRITSHVSGQDIIPDGEPITFTAVTDPPGYEDQITWVSSTKYGTAVPATGRGSTFTVQFDDTWGPHAIHDVFRWLGVKADNDVFNQDQKPGFLTYSVWTSIVGDIDSFACQFYDDFSGESLPLTFIADPVLVQQFVEAIEPTSVDYVGITHALNQPGYVRLTSGEIFQFDLIDINPEEAGGCLFIDSVLTTTPDLHSTIVSAYGLDLSYTSSNEKKKKIQAIDPNWVDAALGNPSTKEGPFTEIKLIVYQDHPGKSWNKDYAEDHASENNVESVKADGPNRLANHIKSLYDNCKCIKTLVFAVHGNSGFFCLGPGGAASYVGNYPNQVAPATFGAAISHHLCPNAVIKMYSCSMANNDGTQPGNGQTAMQEFADAACAKVEGADKNVSIEDNIFAKDQASTQGAVHTATKNGAAPAVKVPAPAGDLDPC